METIVDEVKLEYWCGRLPESASFLQNFFLTCGSFSFYENRLNYASDVALYSSTENWDKKSLLRAFDEITLTQ